MTHNTRFSLNRATVSLVPKHPPVVVRHGSVGLDERINRFSDLHIRCLDDLTTAAKVILHRMYFEGLDVLRCFEGRFVFTIDDNLPITIGSGEVLVIYPGHYVTIKALDRQNRLVYGIFTGGDVVDYFNSLGFFDGLRGAADAQFESLSELMEMVADPDLSKDDHESVCLSFLTDILITMLHDIRENGDSLLFDALKLIRRNLQRGIVRLEPLCDDLKVSRSYLHRIFARAKIGTPADFIRSEQLRIAVTLLRTTRLPIGEIARRAGFISTTHFATFVRRHAGHAPTEIRRMG